MHAIIAECFSQLTKELCAWLRQALPRLSDNWWQNHVLDQLSFQQVKIVEQHGITELTKLDLVALLRIFDRNWFEVSIKNISLERLLLEALSTQAKHSYVRHMFNLTLASS